VLAAYTYKYAGSSERWQRFKGWTYSGWRKCSTSTCTCVCCPDDGVDGCVNGGLKKNVEPTTTLALQL
jgi:hypothetical protein